MPHYVLQVSDTKLEVASGWRYEAPSEPDEDLLEPLRRQLGSMPPLKRLLLRGTTPAAFALSELPPLRVGDTIP